MYSFHSKAQFGQTSQLALSARHKNTTTKLNYDISDLSFASFSFTSTISLRRTNETITRWHIINNIVYLKMQGLPAL